jgi:hypothetical protein
VAFFAGPGIIYQGYLRQDLKKKMRLDDSSKYGERKAIPLDMLPVNLDKLSVPPKTNFFTNIVVPFAMPIPNSCSLSVRALEIAHRIYL